MCPLRKFQSLMIKQMQPLGLQGLMGYYSLGIVVGLQQLIRLSSDPLITVFPTGKDNQSTDTVPSLCSLPRNNRVELHVY